MNVQRWQDSIMEQVRRDPRTDTLTYRLVAENLHRVHYHATTQGTDEDNYGDLRSAGLVVLMEEALSYRGDTFGAYVDRAILNAVRREVYRSQDTERKSYPRKREEDVPYVDEPEDEGGDAQRAVYTDAEARPIVGQYTSQAARGHEDRVLAKIDRERQRADTQWLTRRFLRLLTERQREAIVLVYGLHGFAKHTQAQAAERLGVDQSNIARRVQGAMKRMRAAL